jgi:hypothetical protein
MERGNMVTRMPSLKGETYHRPELPREGALRDVTAGLLTLEP